MFLQACTVLAHLIITFFLAFIICILFESPIHGLEKILLSKSMYQNNVFTSL